MGKEWQLVQLTPRLKNDNINLYKYVIYKIHCYTEILSKDLHLNDFYPILIKILRTMSKGWMERFFRILKYVGVHCILFTDKVV